MAKNEATPIRLPGGERAIRPVPGSCLWCGKYVESDRDATGATGEHDASWTVPGTGDFGCDRSPYTGDEGTGDHARPYDLAVLMLREARRD